MTPAPLPHHPAWATRALLLVTALLQAGCMVLPRTTTTYDHACRVYARQVTLEAVPISGVMLSCSTSSPANCTAGLVVAGIVGSASAVVSGSIAIVGNVLYWIEKQGNCINAPPAPAPGIDLRDPLLVPMPVPVPVIPVTSPGPAKV